MSKVTPETLAVLENLNAERKALRAFKEDFEYRKAVEYETATKAHTERIHALVGQAYEMGASKYKIGQYYMTKDARTISELVATAPSWKDAKKSTARPTFEFPTHNTMTVVLENVDLTPIGYEDTYTGKIPFVLDESTGDWDYDTAQEGYDMRVAGLIADVLALRSDEEWNADYDKAKEN